MSLDNVRIVMVQTSHSGNIGSAARAMKTMGLSKLYLVNPKSFPDEQANIMSSNALDVLENASVCDSLEAAVSDCQVVIGTSARFKRTLRWHMFEPRECGHKAADSATLDQQVALVFGRERTGLTNDELALCQHLVHIPTNPDYSSLNVASAVQLLSYETRVSYLEQSDSKEDLSLQEEIVDMSQMEGFYQQLEQLMIETEFLDPEDPRYFMRRMRRLYGRIQITQSEMNLLRGTLSAFQGRKFQRRKE